MTCGPTRANLRPTHANLHPIHANLHPTHTDLHPNHADLYPACTDLRLTGTKNQPELTLGALFHRYFHVLRWVQ